MKKRYNQEIIRWDLPKKDDRSIYLGKIAETGIFDEKEAYFNVDELTKHMIIAGSTGSGKTITAQIIAEEAFEKGISVVVVDPTVQWTGFIKELEDQEVKKKYEEFGMKRENAKGYPTNIICLNKNKHFTKPGEFINKNEINVLVANELTEKEIDNTITEIISLLFKSNLEEHKEIQTLLFFEEIHRILPKYGGSGNGLIALERAVREFRKWGIGIVLISQVLEDFVGEIRANIGTEMQLRTSYEIDLNKIQLKYGDNMVKSVVREETGTVMMHNSDYNLGNPFFIKIRPPFHSIYRMPNEELKKYILIKEKIIDFEKLKLQYKDETNLNLAKKQLLKGNISKAEMHLNEISKNNESIR